MNGPCFTPSARVHDQVGSGYGAGVAVVPASHASFGISGSGTPASTSEGASMLGGGTTCRSTVADVGGFSIGSTGAALGPAGPEPQAMLVVKITSNVCEQCTELLWHEP